MKIRKLFKGRKSGKLLFEVAVVILFIVLFIGILNTMKYTSKTVILTTEDLLDQEISIKYLNTTSGECTSTIYNITDVATFYNGKLYISIPSPPTGYDTFSDFIISTNITFNELVDKGLSKIHVYIEILNSSSISQNPTFDLDHFTEWWSWHSGDRYIIISSDEAFKVNNESHIYIEKDVDVDLGNLILYVTSGNFGNDYVALRLLCKTAYSSLDGIVFSIEMYTISEKPMLSFLTEPVYAFASAIYGALVAMWQKIKSVALGAIGSFSLSTIFSGLIGDPMVALAITVVVILAVILIFKPKRRR